MASEPTINPIVPGFNGTDSAEILVNTKYSDTMTKTDAVSSQVSDAMTAMLTLLQNWDGDWTNVIFGANSGIGPNSFTTSVSFKDLPKTAPKNPITDADYQTISQSVPNLSFSFAQDAPPEFESLLSTVKGKLSDVITQAGMGLIGASAEDAMYRREESRDLQALADSKQRAASDWNKRRFPLPGAGLFSALVELDGKYQDRMMDRSREVTVEARKAEIENMQFALKESADVIQFLVAYKEKYWDRELERAKELITATLEIFKAKIEVIKIKAQTFESENQAFAAQIGALVKIAEGEIAIINAKVNYSEAEARVDIENAKGKLGLKEFQYNASDSMNKAKANIYSQLYASLIGAVSASAQIQASLSAQTQFSTSVGTHWQHNTNTTTQQQ